MNEYIHRTKLCEDVAVRMIEHIRAQKWEAGSKLPSEPELAEFFGVSRETVRSAVRMLQKSGILYSKRGSGTYVRDNALTVLESKELAMVLETPRNIYALVQARYVLEPQLSALAVENATQEEIRELFETLELMEKNPDRHSLMTYGYRFHQLVVKASHNSVLYRFYQSIASQLRGLRVLEDLTLETFLEGIEQHRAIANAIADRNGALAKELMRAHLKKDYGGYLTCPDILE